MVTKKQLLTVLLGFALFMSNNAYAQIDDKMEKMENVMEDVFNEMDNDVMTIRFYDALTGNPVQGASIMIENVGNYETDMEGRVMFPKQADGYLRAIFKKNGYITALFKVDVVAETIFKNRFVVSPELQIDQIRVVLDWEQKPADLDAHFVKENIYHISFRDTRVLADGTGMLDRDDMDGYGPETITVRNIDQNARYTYFVYNYSDHKRPQRPSMAQSKASVSVYSGNKLLKTYQVPGTLDGKVWNVFSLVDGQLVDNN